VRRKNHVVIAGLKHLIIILVMLGGCGHGPSSATLNLVGQWETTGGSYRIECRDFRVVGKPGTGIDIVLADHVIILRDSRCPVRYREKAPGKAEAEPGQMCIAELSRDNGRLRIAIAHSSIEWLGSGQLTQYLDGTATSPDNSILSECHVVGFATYQKRSVANL
jgi:hypothetical protein